ncbi:Casparian strip membrane protein domain [Arabidopsis thaliana x Arabidopsis arenosa]|uniref:CASP-like protein n=1 Tax=Arabidopsis thaliana x Arabidopsis arenosa TaxID=1240361 RepID=A0A8T1ZQA2_9BRAS|nr:Casparian strip membrane protein domain [Arabidopsis thaliana x Arabidopsis arenosa]KAG7560381.1 Casparian strip membrane protein domain [Arabidopsis thaliana x Arabidopsis arenosa]KAG7560382.1 Casparian strip membrane protein domain [Arabidopsis thaliana x Arabidopsis arenosa]
MENVPGSFGTSASFVLRFGQTIFSAASLIFMCFDYDFYDFTTFCYLATVMAIVTPWSILLALTDTYSVLVKLLPQELRVLSIVFAGDFVLSFLSLGGACAVASATELLASADGKICVVTSVSNTKSRLHWLSCVGFCYLLQLFSIFGVYLLYTIDIDCQCLLIVIDRNHNHRT